MGERFFERVNKLSKIVLLSAMGISAITCALGHNGILDYHRYEKDSKMYHVSAITKDAVTGIVYSSLHQQNFPFTPLHREYFD